ncbi:PAS domain-containing protein [Ruegeria profundi]|uniref:PAS domain-containing protein n=1 Tax=Ruegeria profundi TaxID=1685378 RepID=UPI003C7D3CFF
MTQFSELDAGTLKSLLTHAADILLFVSEDGLINDIIGDSKLLGSIGAFSWCGQLISDALPGNAYAQFREFLSDVGNDQLGHECVVRHETGDGLTKTIAYSAALLSEQRTGIVLGKDISAFSELQNRVVELHRMMGEKLDAQKRVEAEYRTLFSIGSEPFLIVNVASGQITDANPAVAKTLGEELETLSKRSVVSLFRKSDHKELKALLGAVSRTQAQASLQARFANGQPLVVDVSPSFGGSETVIVRLRPAGSASGQMVTEDVLVEWVRAAVEAIVVTDEAGKVIWHNTAFEELVHLTSSTSERGLGEFFDPADLDFASVLKILSDNPRIRSLPASVRRPNGQILEVELSGTVIPDSDPRRIGFAIRNLSTRLTEDSANSAADASIETMLSRIGKAPLRELVQEETAGLEKNLILAALKLTGNNRAATAKVLGLSRQGLYSKLDRYGLGSD